MDKRLLTDTFTALPESIKTSRPACGLILGSGWSEAVRDFERVESLDYAEIPGLGKTGVQGHAGQLVLARYHNTLALVFCGRRHRYEGVGWTPVAIPVDICRRLQIPTLLVTNAAGGINPRLKPGDLMVIRDHINSVGVNPLQGAHDPDWGPRFPDQSEVYTPGLIQKTRAAASAVNVELNEGIYAFTAGPVYETPAEVKALRMLGADAVGMSTVPETTLASAAGLNVCAISCITNMAAGIDGPDLSHEDVLAETRRTTPRMCALIQALIPALTAKT